MDKTCSLQSLVSQTNMTTITPFTIDLYDDVLALWQACEGVGLSSADERDNIQFYLERNPGMSFVAWDGEQVIGAVLCGHDGRRGYLHHMAVHPAYRRQKIGGQLVDRCLEALQAIGLQKCHLFIFTENEPGVAFWQAIGWEYRTDVAIMSKLV